MIGNERLGRVVFSGHNLALFICVALFLALGPVNTFALHNSTADLEPRWSPEGAMVNYTVVIGNLGPDTVTEVRIYKNENYEDFNCEQKTGWELLFISSLQACFYVQDPDTIPSGQSDTFKFSAKTKIQPAEVCDLEWRFETRDNNNVWQFVFNVTGIDHDPPLINKSIFGASFGPCPPGSGETCWIRQDTGVNIYAIHPATDQCNSGLAYCNWSYTVDGAPGASGTFFPGANQIINETIFFEEDSLHILNVTCVDNALNSVNDVEAFRVDSTKPVTTKEEGTPKKVVQTNSGDVTWISTKTPITLKSMDPDPTGHSCNVSVNATYYRNLLMTANGIDACHDEDLCDPEYYSEFVDQQSNLSWSTYVAPFNKKEDSCHIIEYYSVDKLGNRENTKWQCIFVDNKPPESVKVHGTPLVRDEGFDWVTQNTTITLDCKDQDPHPVAQETLCYKVTLDDKSPSVNLTANYCSKSGGTMNNANYCCIYVGDDGIKRNLTLKFLEDSNHSLSYYCTDHLGNDERNSNDGLPNIQRYKVDTKPPAINKTMFGSYLGKCPPKNESDICYVADNSKSGVNITIKDGGDICSVDKVKCHYDIFWDISPGHPVESGDFSSANKTIIFKEDSRHTLIINCTDALGNSVNDREVFLVDSTPPVTNKTYSAPIYIKGTTKWITSNTTITLNATDNKAGVNNTYWRNLLLTKNGESACSSTENCNSKFYNQFIANDTGWKQYQGPFRKPEDSCHVIEYYSTDKLGNKENTKWQCVFVDNKPPLMNKTVGTPRFECPDEELCSYYITGNTSITLSCTDQEPHPSDNVSVLYRYRIGNDCLTWGNWTGWIDPVGTQVKKTIYFKEDSCHQIEYYCKDALGNMEKIYTETDVVDSKPPIINKTIIGPMSGKCPPVNKTDVCFIDNVTEIRVNSTDQLPHPSGNVTCDWSYTVRGTKIAGGNKSVASPFSIKFPEESIHDLSIVCKDALGNKATDTQTFYVDHTPPATTKKYKGPFFMDGKTGPEWISQNTSINLTVVDAGPHKSGINATKYRTTLVEDRYCMNQTICQTAQGSGEWKTYSKEFNISQDSCHLIEYFSTDNVNKSETVKKQCAFVDTMAPDPAKTVAEPKTKWDGLDSTFYPEIKDLCWNGKQNGIECWKVTLFTPITLHCKDPLPHPVNHESLCFKVDFDGTDKTQDYCEEGDMNKGWCCGYPAGTELYFSEESEHNLKYYCVDALGNTGPVDEEKFKVEGTTFNITINKKWNLISVPFVMLNDSISDVFKNVTDKVESVWTFDGKTDEWLVYTPGPAPDTLAEMMPGWGYWVKATNDTVLMIGGSLFRPAKAPPSKEIVEGWNLIGYWGTEGLSGYYGPSGNGKTAACELYSLGPTIWSKEFASLWSYWESYNPNQWLQFSSSRRMDPGAGYWMYTKQQGEFVPPTTCVDNVV